jgi:hypothetical protein
METRSEVIENDFSETPAVVQRTLKKLFKYSTQRLPLLGSPNQENLKPLAKRSAERAAFSSTIQLLEELCVSALPPYSLERDVLEILNSMFNSEHRQFFTLGEEILTVQIRHKDSEFKGYKCALVIEVVKEDRSEPGIAIGISIAEVRTAINKLLNPPSTHSTAKGAQYSSRGGLNDSYER